jgi:hypothetical protein
MSLERKWFGVDIGLGERAGDIAESVVLAVNLCPEEFNYLERGHSICGFIESSPNRMAAIPCNCLLVEGLTGGMPGFWVPMVI